MHARTQGKVDALRLELQGVGDKKDKGYVKTKVGAGECDRTS